MNEPLNINVKLKIEDTECYEHTYRGFANELLLANC